MEARGRTSNTNLSSAYPVAWLRALNFEMPVVDISLKLLPRLLVVWDTSLRTRDLSGGGHIQFRN